MVVLHPATIGCFAFSFADRRPLLGFYFEHKTKFVAFYCRLLSLCSLDELIVGFFSSAEESVLTSWRL